MVQHTGPSGPSSTCKKIAKLGGLDVHPPLLSPFLVVFGKQELGLMAAAPEDLILAVQQIGSLGC